MFFQGRTPPRLLFKKKKEKKSSSIRNTPRKVNSKAGKTKAQQNTRVRTFWSTNHNDDEGDACDDSLLLED